MRLILIAATTLVAVSSIASAHDADCRGRPPPERVKMQCCGRADYHALDPGQIHRDADLNYVVDVDGFTLVVPERNAEPSNDDCSAIFFDPGAQDSEGHPAVFCFETPLGS
jgi:hypothetical protein